MNVLMLSPATPMTFWSFKHAVRFVGARSAFPPLGLLTIAGMLPKHWTLRLVDMDVEKLRDRDLVWADYVMVSAMIVHRPSVEDIARRCHKAGKTIIGGGPLFTTGHQEFPSIDHFVLGEAETLIQELVRDMEAGTLAPVYQSEERPDMSLSPIPRWDLIKTSHYGSMSVQYSRGCPYDCEFCDIVIMNGRRPRTKSPEQVLAELDGLHAVGWRGSVFVVDDNFIGNKGKTKALLRAMIEWRARSGATMDFYTEASMNLADDPELLELMVHAGFKKVFMGIESPSLKSLEECHKVQNLKGSLTEAVQRIQNAGLQVMGGFIVGFDNDSDDIFESQFAFIKTAGVATAMVGLLTALPQTRLYKRLEQEGRLLTRASGNNTEAVLNFTPRLPTQFLVDGYRKLMKSLYEPKAYYERALVTLAAWHPRGPKIQRTMPDFLALGKSLWTIGLRHRGRRAYWGFLARVLYRYPAHFGAAVTLAIYGHHFRQVAKDL